MAMSKDEFAAYITEVAWSRRSRGIGGQTEFGPSPEFIRMAHYLINETREQVAREIRETSVEMGGWSDRESEAWWAANAHAARIARGQA